MRVYDNSMQSAHNRMRVWVCICGYSKRISNKRQRLPRNCPKCNRYASFELMYHQDKEETFAKTKQIDKPLSHYRNRSTNLSNKLQGAEW